MNCSNCETKRAKVGCSKHSKDVFCGYECALSHSCFIGVKTTFDKIMKDKDQVILFKMNNNHCLIEWITGNEVVITFRYKIPDESFEKWVAISPLVLRVMEDKLWYIYHNLTLEHGYSVSPSYIEEDNPKKEFRKSLLDRKTFVVMFKKGRYSPALLIRTRNQGDFTAIVVTFMKYQKKDEKDEELFLDTFPFDMDGIRLEDWERLYDYLVFIANYTN